MSDLRKTERQLKAVANQRRLRIIKFLKQGQAPVTDISRAINLSYKSTSKHLQQLSAVNILETHQVHLHVFYRLSKKQEEPVRTLIRCL